ncbi:far upstream element-binding protein 2 isoform X2 [Drosophila busckii]|uniref:far upstream element-binding protein 2 isoform X2 n=1 Tax=Drosophila busckii TaxID=30019 RepID=UPI00083ECA1C|nr:far upstream element-binding protein 2 isoform X2 [Drosophila busckii]
MSDFQAQQASLSQSQALAAAIQRAKQIAAKIQPNQQQQQGGSDNGASSGGGGNNFKRHNDDGDSGPDCKRSFGSPDYGQNNSNMSSGSNGGGSGGNMTQAIAQAAAVAARLAAWPASTCEEQVRVPESIVSSFMGRSGSDTLSHLEVESGAKLELMQDQERVITLRGSRENCTKARDMLQQMVTRNGGNVNCEVLLTINMPPPGPGGYPPYQEIMIPGAKVGLVIGKGGDTIKQLQEKTGARMIIIQDGPNQELIKPLRISGVPQKVEHAKQMVLDLIAQKDAMTLQQAQGAGGGRSGGAGGGGGGNDQGFNNFNNGNGGESVEVFVPKIAVGVVIGKGGDMIRKIQTECGCKLQFIQGKNDEMGDRRCVIQGTRQQVEDAKRTIDGLIENVMQRNGMNRNGNGGGGGGGSQGGNDSNNSNYGYGYGVNHAQGGREEITFLVPASKCGIVIGRGGETIKLINQQSGAHTEMDRNASNPPNEKLFKSKGTTDQVESARQMISEKINMELTVISRKPISGGGGGGGGGSGGGGGGGSSNPHHNQQQGGYGGNQMQGADPNAAAAAAYQQQQQQPWGAYGQQGGWDPATAQQQQQMAMAAGQAQAGGAANTGDYSAQWIEYYKQIGCHREADMIEQQMKAKQAAGASGQAAQQPQQQQAQQAGAADFSAQWAEYYRSVGKVEEAEAIEKSLKNKQNGAGAGVNSSAPNAAQAGPNASQPNAAAAAAYAQAAAAGHQPGAPQPQGAAGAAGGAGGPPAGYPGGYPGSGYGYGPGGPGGAPGQQQQAQKGHKSDKH